MPRLGILAIQGDFHEHIQALDRLGVESLEIRKTQQLDEIDGLIIPGGESTTIVQLIDIFGFREVLVQKVKGGMPVKFRSATGELEVVPPRLEIVGRLERTRAIAVDDFAFVRDAASGEPYDASEGMGGKVAKHMREQCELITRFVGDHLVIAPPLIVNESEIDHIVGAFETAVNAVTGP